MPQPAKPAVQSGPGAMSQRTDGGVASKQAQRYVSGMPNYGDGQELATLQQQAPMAATQGAKPASKTAVLAAAQQGQQPSSQGQGTQQGLVPLSAPTQRPDEPVTAGSPMGAGPGPEALGIQPGQIQMAGQSAKQLVKTLASHPDASPELQRLSNLLGK